MRPIRLQARILVPLLVLIVAMGAYPGVVRSADATYVPSKAMWAAKRSNVRAGPGTSYRKVGLLEVGEEVRVTAKTGNWYQLVPQAGQSRRFVYAPLLTATRLVVRTITYNNGNTYHGQTRNGIPHGRGAFTWKGTGEYADREGRYEGDFVDGKRTGRGVKVWPNGDRCEGQWRDNKQHGHATCAWANGNRYEGDFVDGKRTGRGVFTFSNGDRYEGDFVDGKRTGRGVYTWVNGNRYEGIS